MVRTLEELEAKYDMPDPWGYQTNEDDAERKRRIIAACRAARSYIVRDLIDSPCFDRALDVGAGEGWITTDLPAHEIYAIEASDQAAARFPPNVFRIDVDDVLEDPQLFDLVLATGVLYDHYDLGEITRIIRYAAAPGAVIVTCNLEDSERPLEGYAELYTERFAYRGRFERLRVLQA